MSPLALLAIVPKARPVPNMTPVEIRLLAEGRLRVHRWSPIAPGATAPWDRPESRREPLRRAK